MPNNIDAKKTYTIKLTKHELVHLRDLFSVGLPPTVRLTVSQALAMKEGRKIVETVLWKKVVKACQDAQVALDDDAPDFVVSASEAPPIDVFLVAAEEPSPDAEGNLPNSMFTEDE